MPRDLPTRRASALRELNADSQELASAAQVATPVLLLTTAASALLSALAFPPFEWRFVAWMVVVPYLWALYAARDRLGLRCLLGALHGVLFAYGVGTWFADSIANYYHQPTFVGVIFFLGVAGVMVAPYHVAFAAIFGPLARRFQLSLPLFVAAAWVAADFARGSLFTGTFFFIGNPWALLGYSQVGIESLVQMASVTGVYGITFAIISANAGLAQTLWKALDPVRTKASLGVGALAAGLAPGVILFAYGTLLPKEVSPSEQGSAVEVAIVQGNLDLGSRWRREFYGTNLETYLRLTLDSLAAKPEIVFWPEGAMTFFLESEPAYRRSIARVLHGADATLVAGGPAVGEDDEFFNSVFLLSPEGEVEARYDKQYLVPLSEYFPLPELDFLRRRFEKVRQFTHGGASSPLETAAGLAGVLVCNEAMLPEVASRRVREGATIFVNPSNDSWINDLGFVAQQFDIVSLRAVEQRRYLVRASTAGPSAIVDPFGRVQVETEPGSRSFIAGQVRPISVRTLYSRVGNLFAFLCVAASAGGVLWVRVRQSETTPDETPGEAG